MIYRVTYAAVGPSGEKLAAVRYSYDTQSWVSTGKLTLSSNASLDTTKLYSTSTSSLPSTQFDSNLGVQGSESDRLKAYSTVSGYVFKGWYALPSDVTWPSNSGPEYYGAKYTKFISGKDVLYIHHVPSARASDGYVALTDSLSGLYSVTNSTGIVTLFVVAKFARPQTYTVTYTPGTGASGTAVADTKTEGVNLTLRGATFTRTGYTQTGWATSDGGAQAYVLGDTYSSNSSVTLYPVWTANVRVATFSANGGTGGASVSIPYGASVSSYAPAVQRTGYTLSGWSPSLGTMPDSDQTYVAQWTVNQYTQTFYHNDGVSGPTVKVQDFGSALTPPQMPSRAGWEFAGWNPPVPNTVPASNQTYQGQWTHVQRVQRFYSSDPSAVPYVGDTDTVTGYYGDSLSAPTFQRAGYTFAGWSPSVPSTIPDHDQTYVAVWTPNSYTVTLVDGDSGTLDVQVTATYGSPMPSATMPVLAGYEFVGFFAGQGGAGRKYYDADGTSANAWDQTSDSDIYAAWTQAQSFTIRFDRRGGSGGTSFVTCDRSTRQISEASIDPPVLIGHSFTGYFTGSDTQYYDSEGDQVLSSWGSEPDDVLYAGWEPNSYTVTLVDGDSGTLDVQVTATYGSPMPSATMPVRTGAFFMGFFESPNGAGRKYYDADGTSANAWDQTSDSDIYAAWTARSYTVTFDANGGTGGTVSAVAYGAAISAPAVQRAGYTFAGWSPSFSEGDAMSDDDCTYVAQWTPNSYTVTLVDGDSGTLDVQVTATYGSPMPSATMPVLAGYEFVGFFAGQGGAGRKYYDADGTSANAWDQTSDSDIYAAWTARSYTVTFDANGGTGGTVVVGPQGGSLSAPAVQRAGYTFAGWSPSVPSTIPDHDQTYVAQWTVNQYVQVFDANGGVGGGTVVASYGDALSAPYVTRYGRLFVGWSPAVPATVPASDETYVAQWADGAYVNLSVVGSESDAGGWLKNLLTVGDNNGYITSTSIYTTDLASYRLDYSSRIPSDYGVQPSVSINEFGLYDGSFTVSARWDMEAAGQRGKLNAVFHAWYHSERSLNLSAGATGVESTIIRRYYANISGRGRALMNAFLTGNSQGHDQGYDFFAGCHVTFHPITQVWSLTLATGWQCISTGTGVIGI